MSGGPSPLWGVLLIGLVFAGCLQGPDLDAPAPAPAAPSALPRCFDTPLGLRCDQLMTVDPMRSGNEVTIAVDPTDPDIIVGGAKDYAQPDAGECVWVGVYVTDDGGATYLDRSLEGSPRRLLDGDPSDFQLTPASHYWCTTDPVVTFDAHGTLYYLFMAYQGDPVTASRLGEGIVPRHPFGGGAVNDWALNRGAQMLAISTDGGRSFDRITSVYEGVFPLSLPDKGWVEVGPTGTIHVLWLSIFVPGNQYCRSTDGGATFDCTGIVALQFIEGGQGSFLVAGPDGEVYAFWKNGARILMRRSLDDGVTWLPISEVKTIQPQAMPGLSPRDHRDAHPMFAVDRNPDSPHHGRLYVTWSDRCQDLVHSVDCATGNNSVYVAWSDDQGVTWSDGVRVNDDLDADGAPSAAHWQIFPALSVSPGGVVDVSWMDTRGTRWSATPDGTAYPTFEQYHAFSIDGGASWSANLRIRDVADGGWDPSLSLHQNGMVFIGDYNDIDSSWGAAHPVWPDTRNGHADVYTAVVERPLFADGWDEADRERLVAELVAAGLVRPDHPFL